MFPASSSELRELHNALQANILYHMDRQKAEVRFNLARDFRITNTNDYFIETPGVVYLLFASTIYFKLNVLL